MSSYSRRRSAVFSHLDDGNVDAILVSSPVNVRYLTGFTGSNGWLLLGAGEAHFLTDPRYADQAADEVRDATIHISSKGLERALHEALAGTRGRRLGLEAANVTVALRAKLEDAVEADWVPLDDAVERVRRCKDEGEIASVQAALVVTEAALEEVAAGIAPGQHETDVAAALEFACRRRGATRMAFDTIVAAGERSALPHGVASDRVIHAGEPVMIDMGCVLDGYCSDITRMVWVGGDPDADWLALHALVDRARRVALEAVESGASCRDIDAAARAVIAEAGHGDAFSHGTGHGVGLEIHEAPTVSPRSDDRLAAGMVVTIEPAVYLSGTYGIRLEDLVAVTDGGCRRLTALGTEPILPGIS